MCMNTNSELIQEMGPDDIARQGLESRRIVIVAPQEGQVRTIVLVHTILILYMYDITAPLTVLSILVPMY
jgi:hypothetical protein